jgi:hypothetical protein
MLVSSKPNRDRRKPPAPSACAPAEPGADDARITVALIEQPAATGNLLAPLARLLIQLAAADPAQDDAHERAQPGLRPGCAEEIPCTETSNEHCHSTPRRRRAATP